MRMCLYGLAAALVAALTVPSFAAAADKDSKKRLLVITESQGFRHGCVTRKGDELSLVEKTLTELGEKNGFDVVCSQDSRSVLTAENLKNFDAVFFYTTGELPLSDTQKADLLQFIRSGKGFAGSHSATDTFYRWPDYGNLIGGYFDGHPWHKKITVLVEDTKHPATKHLGDSFVITDEIYQFRAPYDRSKLHVLMRMDMKDEKGGKRKDNDNALAWTHRYGNGRVFYTALGHRDEVWKDERFQKHIVGGLRDRVWPGERGRYAERDAERKLRGQVTRSARTKRLRAGSVSEGTTTFGCRSFANASGSVNTCKRRRPRSPAPPAEWTRTRRAARRGRYAASCVRGWRWERGIAASAILPELAYGPLLRSDAVACVLRSSVAPTRQHMSEGRDDASGIDGPDAQLSPPD